MHAWAIEGYGAANVGLLGALDDEDIKEIGTLLRYDGGPPPLQIKFIKKALASEVAEEAQRAAERDKRRTPNTDFTQSRVAGSSNEAADSNDDESAASGGSDGSESDDDEPARSTGRAIWPTAAIAAARLSSRATACAAFLVPFFLFCDSEPRRPPKLCLAFAMKDQLVLDGRLVA